MITALQPRHATTRTGAVVGKAERANPLAPFTTVLDGVLRGPEPLSLSLRFSNHARQRMAERGVDLSETDLSRIEQATLEAASKGGRESLLLMNQTASDSGQCGDSRLALLLSVPNRTVITVVAQDDLKDAVFTNIDSAVLVADAPPSPNTTTTGRTPQRDAHVPLND